MSHKRTIEAEQASYTVNDLMNDLERADIGDHVLYANQLGEDDAFTVRDAQHALDTYYEETGQNMPAFMRREQNAPIYPTLERLLEEAQAENYLEKERIGVDLSDPDRSPLYCDVTFYRLADN